MAGDVVKVIELESNIAIIKMQDRVSKNTFSPELVSGLNEAFQSVQNTSKYKVVVLTGYDSYFATGGTKESLLSLHKGNGKFTDSPLYELPMRCEIPVISAMQGHGIGGGFVMGLFSDFVVLSRESIYSANFMKYGFTPGFGSTYILREKLGSSMAHEMLMSAKNYRGEELHKRGVSFPAVPRSEVLECALVTAKSLAEKPRISLTTLKTHLTESIRANLPLVTAKEIVMHNKTFHLPEVKERIRELFDQ